MRLRQHAQEGAHVQTCAARPPSPGAFHPPPSPPGRAARLLWNERAPRGLIGGAVRSAGPWEHVLFGAIGGSYFAHKVLELEEWSASTLETAMRQKLDANKASRAPSGGRGGAAPTASLSSRSGSRGGAHCSFGDGERGPTVATPQRRLRHPLTPHSRTLQGVLDERYREVLGDKYDKYFPNAQ